MWNFWRKPKQVKSSHKVEVVPVVLLPHGNADSLSIVKVWGYQCVVRTEDWQGVTQAAYIQPDSMVPQTKEFEFLTGGKPWHPKYQRITARKLRGERSEGLLMPAPRGSRVGDNVAERMNITRYVSPTERREMDQCARGPWWSRINNRGRKGLSFAGNERGPSIWIPVYDLENFYRYPDLFSNGDVVAITEKIHGCNARFTFSSADNRMYAGSRTTWKRPSYPLSSSSKFRRALESLRLVRRATKPATDDWNTALRNTPAIEAWCRAHPDHVLFGEIYGDVQDLRYGHGQGEVSVVVFDVFHKGEWWSWQQIEDSISWNQLPGYMIQTPPVLYKGPFDETITKLWVDGNTLLPGPDGKPVKQMREGIVIRLLNTGEAEEPRRGYPGRKILKAVSSAYLERSSKDENPQPRVGG